MNPLAKISLGQFDVMAFAPTIDAKRAVEFYRDTLGLSLISQDGFAAAFDAHGFMLRVTSVPKPLTPQPFTVLGWKVPDIAAAVKGLAAAGVEFERYMDSQDDLNIWTAPGGAKVAWFKDQDGNILSLTEF
jgi:catechol 2,3-dioxygenase-like lactoylglutathione lyase family enzyme